MLTIMNSMEIATSAGGNDPATGLRGVAALRRLVERLETLQVDRARGLGWSWAQIAVELGVSKQAVHQKHGGGRVRTSKEDQIDV
jgi:cytolysin (calcineurin-like family phosphatase)